MHPNLDYFSSCSCLMDCSKRHWHDFPVRVGNRPPETKPSLVSAPFRRTCSTLWKDRQKWLNKCCGSQCAKGPRVGKLKQEWLSAIRGSTNKPCCHSGQKPNPPPRLKRHQRENTPKMGALKPILTGRSGCRSHGLSPAPGTQSSPGCPRSPKQPGPHMHITYLSFVASLSLSLSFMFGDFSWKWSLLTREWALRMDKIQFAPVGRRFIEVFIRCEITTPTTGSHNWSRKPWKESEISPVALRGIE